MANLNTQIKVGADSSGVATGLEPGKRALKDFGASADGAGKSLAGMGNGSAQSAQKVEQATKSMIQSIQRTTAATEAGDKSTRAYQESLARMRGIDVNALKPYLDQLDSAKMKAEQAATANNSLGDSFSGIGSRSVIAAGAIGAIGAALSAAFSAASIKGVIDVADTFSKLSQKSGVAVEALRELNYAASLSDVSTEALGTGLRKLSQNMASAAGGGKEQAAAFAAIGVSVKGMDGALKGADVVLSEIAGKFANFSDGPEKAALAIELFGKQGADMIPLLNSGTSGLSEMAKEATELGIVFGSDLAKNAETFNDNLTRIQTSAEGAKIAIANELLPTLNYLAQAFLDAQKSGSGFGSFIGGALKTIIEAATILYSDVEFVLKGIGREFGAIGAQVVALGKLDIKGFNAISAAVKEDGVRARAELDKFQYDLLNAGILSSKAGAGRGTATDPRLLGGTQTAAPIVAAIAATKELREIVNKAAKEDIAAFRLMADLKTKFEGEEIARIEKTREELEKTMEAYAKSAEAGVASAIATATAAEAELSNYGLLKSEVQALGLVHLEQARESAAMAGEDVSNIEKRIAAQKRLIAATKGVELRTSSDNAAKEAAAEWKKTSDSINSTLTDALMRGFESGKDFARNLRDTVVNMFKTLVLRPIISAVINPVAGALTGALGLSGAAQAASTGGSVLSSVGTIAGLASTFGAGLKAGFAGLMGEAGLMGTLSAGTTALGAGNIAGGLGTLAGPLALATAAILGLSAIIKATSGETRNGAAYGVGSDGRATLLQGPSGGEIASVQARQMFDATKASIEGMLTAFGSKAVLTGFTAGLESSENGKGFAYSTGKINGVAFGDQNTYMNSRGDKSQEQALKDYQQELSQSILEALQVTTDIPGTVAKLISDGLNGSEVKAMSADAVNAILANVAKLSTEVNTFNAAMTQLPFEALKNLSFDATAGLIAAAGGFEKLDASLTGYYQNFYSQEEQRAQSITNTEAAFAALGLTMPALDESARSAYRAMVEAAAGQDLTVEANQKAYAALLALQGPMNELAPAFGSVTTSLQNVAASAAEAAATMTSAWASVMQSRGVAANDVTRFTAQAAIDAAFTEFKKTDKFGIASASQFQTITQADFKNYTGENQKLIATILTGLSDLSKANAPAVVEAQAAQTYTQDSYTAPDTSIADAIAQITKGLTDAGVSLGVELLKAQGKTFEAMSAQRAIDTAGYNAAQVALYDYNQTLRDQITAANEATAAQQAFSSKRQSLQQQYDDLTLTQDQKRNAQWLSLNAQDPTGQLSGLQIAIWDFGDAAAKTAKDVSDAAAAASSAAAAAKEKAANELATAITRNDWRDKLDVLMGSRTQEQLDTQNALAGVTDMATVELIMLVRGLEKTQAAAASTAAAAKELADKAEAAAQALASTNQGWQDQLDVLTGAQSDRSLALRDATDASTVALMKQVYAQQDLKTTAEAATAAAQQVADERSSLQDQLNQATLTNAQLMGLQREALDASNRSLFDQVQAATAAKTAADEAAQAVEAMAQRVKGSIESLASNKLSLQSQLLTAQGNPSGALATTRGNELSVLTAGLSATDAAAIASAYAYNTALEDQIKTLNDATAASDALKAKQEALVATNKGYQDQLDVLTGAQTDRSIALRDATESSTAELMRQVYAQQDLKASAEKAAAAQEALSATNKGYQDQLDVLTGTQTDRSIALRDATDASTAALLTQIYAQQDSKAASEEAAASIKALAATNKGYQDQLDVLLGTQTNRSIALRDATDDSTRALMQQVYAQQDLKTASEAATAAAKAVTDERDGLQQRLNTALGRTAALRQLEIDKLDATNRPLLARIFAIEDTRSATDAALASVGRAVEKQKESLTAQAQVARETVSTLSSLFDYLDGSVKDLYASVQGTADAASGTGKTFIADALAAFTSTGYLPEQSALSDAVSAVRKGIDAAVIGQAEADFQTLVLAGQLDALKVGGESQLTAAEAALKANEAQLKTLDSQLQAARDQVDVMRGVDLSVISVAAAIISMDEAMRAERAARAAGTAAVGGSLTSSEMYSNSDIAKANAYIDKGLNQEAIKATEEAYRKVANDITDMDNAGGAAYRDAIANGGDGMAARKAAIAAAESAMGYASGHFDNIHKALFESKEAWKAEIDAIVKPSADYLEREARAAAQVEAGKAGKPLPAYAKGTNYVPEDGPAYLHKGEAVIPVAFNQPFSGSGNARMESLIEGLTAEVQRLQSIVNDGNAHTRRTADAVNGNPEMPMLVETV